VILVLTLSATSSAVQASRCRSEIPEYRKAGCIKDPIEIDDTESDCPEAPADCDALYPFRTIDGTCNNLKQTRWGEAERVQNRIVPSAYEDGMCYIADYNFICVCY